MLGVAAYIAFKGNCREAIEFYKSALGAEVLFTQTMGESPLASMGPAENIMHCTVQVGDSKMMMYKGPNSTGAASSGDMSLALGLTDVDRARQLFGNLSEGGLVIMPLGKTLWACPLP